MSPAPAEEAQRMGLTEARTKLAGLWLAGSGLLFAVLVLQSIGGKFHKNQELQKAWSWFIPTVVPTLALMLSVLGAGALAGQDARQVRADFFRLAWWLSLAYLLVLAGTLVLQPFSPMDAIELFTASNYWLTPMQGLVVAATGVLFTTNEKGTRPPSRRRG